MTAHYEALRAQVTGTGTLTTSPRGLVLLMRAGVVGWLSAMRQLTSSVSSAAPQPSRQPSPASLPLVPDLVVLLAEMALNRLRACPS